MANFGSILNAIDDALRLVDGLNVYDTEIEEREPPCAYIRHPSANFEVAIGGTGADYRLEVVVEVSAVDGRSARVALGEYLSRTGNSSIATRLLADATLAGACNTLFVRGFTDWSDERLADGRLRLSAAIPVEVVA